MSHSPTGGGGRGASQYKYKGTCAEKGTEGTEGDRGDVRGSGLCGLEQLGKQHPYLAQMILDREESGKAAATTALNKAALNKAGRMADRATRASDGDTTVEGGDTAVVVGGVTTQADSEGEEGSEDEDEGGGEDEDEDEGGEGDEGTVGDEQESDQESDQESERESERESENEKRNGGDNDVSRDDDDDDDDDDAMDLSREPYDDNGHDDDDGFPLPGIGGRGAIAVNRSPLTVGHLTEMGSWQPLPAVNDHSSTHSSQQQSDNGAVGGGGGGGLLKKKVVGVPSVPTPALPVKKSPITTTTARIPFSPASLPVSPVSPASPGAAGRTRNVDARLVRVDDGEPTDEDSAGYRTRRRGHHGSLSPGLGHVELPGGAEQSEQSEQNRYSERFSGFPFSSASMSPTYSSSSSSSILRPPPSSSAGNAPNSDEHFLRQVSGWQVVAEGEQVTEHALLGTRGADVYPHDSPHDPWEDSPDEAVEDAPRRGSELDSLIHTGLSGTVSSTVSSTVLSVDASFQRDAEIVRLNETIDLLQRGTGALLRERRSTRSTRSNRKTQLTDTHSPPL